jgi:hypothetical protein
MLRVELTFAGNWGSGWCPELARPQLLRYPVLRAAEAEEPTSQLTAAQARGARDKEFLDMP